MENAEYWAERFTALDDKLYKKSEEYARTLQRQFDRARRTITRDLGYWYGRLAENNGISYAEAKKLLKDDELDDFHMTVEEYIKHGREDGLDPAWIKKLENASSKVHISRLEQIQTDLEQTIEELYFSYETGAEMLLESVTTTSYYHTAFEVAKGTGVGVNLHRLDTETIEKFLTTPWCQDGLAFSDRIWARKDELVDTLNTLLAQNLMTGADPQKAIDQLAERLDVDKRAAGRLIMTETAAIGSEARKQCLKDLDVEEFEIVATLDSKTSTICRRMDGQHFPMSQYKIGLNAPPFHCNCRSTTVPWFDDEFTSEDETRAAREPGDTGYNRVPSNMTYKEWEKEYISKNLQSGPDESTIKTHNINNVSTGQKRNEEPLTEEEISQCIDYARELGFKDNIAYSNYSMTGFAGSFEGERYCRLVIGTDVKPIMGDLKTCTPNQLVSYKGALAHEIVGHYEAWVGGFECSISSVDEAQASIRAARFAKGLSRDERYMLIRDALQRLKDDNIKLSDARALMRIDRR